jgi:hypothetical protein
MCLLIQDYCKLYLLFLLENKDQAVYGFRHSTFISIHNDQKWVSSISSHLKNTYILSETVPELGAVVKCRHSYVLTKIWVVMEHLYLGANLFCLTIQVSCQVLMRRSIKHWRGQRREKFHRVLMWFALHVWVRVTLVSPIFAFVRFSLLFIMSSPYVYDLHVRPLGWEPVPNKSQIVCVLNTCFILIHCVDVVCSISIDWIFYRKSTISLLRWSLSWLCRF